MDKCVLHILIRNEDGAFNVGGGPKFGGLTPLIEHYKKNPMVTISGLVLHLKHPFHATTFLPANIFQRISELQKLNPDMCGKTGFWEEFEVCRVYWYCIFQDMKQMILHVALLD